MHINLYLNSTKKITFYQKDKFSLLLYAVLVSSNTPLWWYFTFPDVFSHFLFVLMKLCPFHISEINIFWKMIHLRISEINIQACVTAQLF